MKHLFKIAAATALLTATATFAVPANAQTWTRYVATGAGQQGDTHMRLPSFDTYPVAIRLTFSVLSGPPGFYPGSSGFYQGFTQTGTSFIVRN